MWSGPVQVVSMTCMTFDEVGAPARLSGGPFSSHQHSSGPYFTYGNTVNF